HQPACVNLHYRVFVSELQFLFFHGGRRTGTRGETLPYNELDHRPAVENLTRIDGRVRGTVRAAFFAEAFILWNRPNDQPIVVQAIGDAEIGRLKAIVVADFSLGPRHRIGGFDAYETGCQIHD